MGASSGCHSPPTPHQLTITNMTNAHNSALNDITSKYNAIMTSSETSEYDKAVLVQNLTDGYDPRAEFSSIVEVNGLDMTTICAKNAEILQTQQNVISGNLNATIAEKTTMYTNLQHEIQSIIDRINANKLSLASLNSFKETVITTYEKNITDMLQQETDAQDLIRKINAANLAALTAEWDALFGISDGVINDYLDSLASLAGQIASTILNNEADMKSMHINYNQEIADTHVQNYRKLFGMVSNENAAFSARKSGIADLYSSDGKRNEYDADSNSKIKLVVSWLFRGYIITFILLAITLFRYNSTLSRNVKIAIVAVAAAYPFAINYIELYVYFIYEGIVNQLYSVTGDLRFEPK